MMAGYIYMMRNNLHLFRWGVSPISMPTTGLGRDDSRYLKEINRSLKDISSSLKLLNQIMLKRLLNQWMDDDEDNPFWDDDMKDLINKVKF